MRGRGEGQSEEKGGGQSKGKVEGQHERKGRGKVRGRGRGKVRKGETEGMNVSRLKLCLPSRYWVHVDLHTLIKRRMFPCTYYVEYVCGGSQALGQLQYMMASLIMELHGNS